MTNAYNPNARFKLVSPYGNRIDPLTGIPGKFHSGQDFAAAAGTPIPAAASGKVVYSGFNEKLGNVVIVKNDAGGYSLYGHMQDGTKSQPGERIWQGDTVGLVGSTGSRTTGNHLHYSVITREAGEIIAKDGVPRGGGPIGLPLDKVNTIDPAKYENYDPTPRYVDETKRVAQIMSGASVAPGGLSPDQPGSLGDRFGKWGNVPAGTPQSAPSDRPESFDHRFGNWGSVPRGKFGDSDSPPQPAPENYKRSTALDGRSSAADASSLAPFSGPEPGVDSQPADELYAARERAARLLAGVGRYAENGFAPAAQQASLSPPRYDDSMAGAGVASFQPPREQVRRLVGQIVDDPRASAFDTAQAVGSPLTAGFRSPDRAALVGDRLGNQMPLPANISPRGSTQPSLSPPSGDGELLKYLSDTTLQPPPGNSGYRFASPMPQPPQGSAPPYANNYFQYPSQLNDDNSPPPAFDPTKPPPPFSPSNYASALSSIDHWLSSLTGDDPDDPAEFQVPPIFSPFYRR